MINNDLTEITATSVTVFAIFAVLIEWGLLTFTKNFKNHKESIISIISAGIAFFPIFITTKFILISFMYYLYQYKLFNLGLNWYMWIFVWVIYDFIFYGIHWLGHNSRLFWCLHSVHHTPKNMNLATAFRGSFLDFIWGMNSIYIWLPLLGIHPVIIIVAETFGRFYGIIVHISEDFFSNKKRHWLENIFVSPSYHRVHHAKNHIYLDRNYGETLMIWDILFKTRQCELENHKFQYGVMREIDSTNLVKSQFTEFKELIFDIKSTDKLIEKIKYVFMPPGWNPIDGGKLAKDYRQEALQNELKLNEIKF